MLLPLNVAGKSLLITNIHMLCLVDESGRERVSGAAMSDLQAIPNAWLLAEDGIIVDYGTMPTVPERADRIIEASGKLVMPAFCDSHTHLVFARSREEEFVLRLKGSSYTEIAAAGGGILNSAKKLQEMSEAALFEGAMERMEEIAGFGTGAVEIKSGYGLTTEAELKILRVIRRLKEESKLIVRSTFLGAHAIPAEYTENRSGYIDLVTKEMLPLIAGEGLADYCDVFCETGFFTPEETDQILEAAWKYNIPPRIHANQLAVSGGVQAGVRNNAISVDHLEHITQTEIDCLKDSRTFPTALPSCSFFLNLPYAPGRDIIDAGLPLVLASDYNPGSTPSGKIPFVISLACINMGLVPEEALHAAITNGAAAMQISNRAGSITKGKEARLIITKKMDNPAYIPYAFGSNVIQETILP